MIGRHPLDSSCNQSHLQSPCSSFGVILYDLRCKVHVLFFVSIELMAKLTHKCCEATSSSSSSSGCKIHSRWMAQMPKIVVSCVPVQLIIIKLYSLMHHHLLIRSAKNISQMEFVGDLINRQSSSSTHTSRTH